MSASRVILFQKNEKMSLGYIIAFVNILIYDGSCSYSDLMVVHCTHFTKFKLVLVARDLALSNQFDL